MAAADFPPPPTYASPVLVEERSLPDGSKQTESQFNPIWLDWFLLLAQVLTTAGAGGGGIEHNSLRGLQGGTTEEYYHLTEAQHTDIASGGSFKTIAVTGQDDVVADNFNGTLTLVAGSGVVLTTDESTDSVTIETTGSGVFSGTQIQKAVNVANSTSVVVTLSSTPTVGNILLASIVGSAGQTVSAITQTNVTWTRIRRVVNGNAMIDTWKGVIAASPGTAVTVAATPSGFIDAAIFEYTDLAGTENQFETRNLASCNAMYATTASLVLTTFCATAGGAMTSFMGGKLEIDSANFHRVLSQNMAAGNFVQMTSIGGTGSLISLAQEFI